MSIDANKESTPVTTDFSDIFLTHDMRNLIDLC